MSDQRSYWDSLTRSRLSRRAALRGSMLTGVGVALSLAGCGGGSSSSEGDGSDTGLLSKPVDSSSAAVRGGILPAIVAVDAPSFNSNTSSSTNSNLHNDRAYSKFFTPRIANRAKGEEPSSMVDPDVISSYEFSPDGLQLTMKLRPEAAFDPRPPTNGRKVTVQDVDFAWQVYKAKNKSRGLISNEVTANAPVTSLTTPDANTIVMKLAFPSAALLTTLSYYVNSPYIFPVESEGKFDPNFEMRGSGPWMLDQYTPSASFKYRRNPNWYRKDRPFLDGIDMPIVSEYTSQLAQFRAGNIYSFGISSTDLIPTKKDFPEMTMVQSDFTTALTGSVFFDYRPDKGSIWFDDRLRHALSMSIDRTLFIETMSNSSLYTNEGIPVEIRWNSHVPGGQADYWVDPQGKDFGENAKYFKLNLAEATKLVKAATGKDKVDSAWNIIAGNELGANYKRQAEILHGMIIEGPFNLRTIPLDYVTQFAPKVSTAPRLTGGHDFDGAAYAAMGSPGIDSLFATHYTSGGSFYKFEEDYPKDAQWDNFMKQQGVERDPNKRIEIVKNFQRYAAGKMYLVPYPGNASTFSLGWPWAGNFGTFRAISGSTDHNLWLDKSKMKA